ncbi:TPA: regulator [Escherichia coli]|nr:regulator [Escherichia coli]
MRPNISITLTTPHVTIERYSELTGLSIDTIDTINDMLADGRLIRHRLRKDKKREKVMINIAAMTVDALSECNLNLN